MADIDKSVLDALSDAFNPSTRLGGSIYGTGVMMTMIREGWLRTLIYGVVSVPSAYYTSLLMSHYFASPPGVPGVYGFVGGVFSLRILQRLFAAMERADMTDLLKAVFPRIFSQGGK